LQEFHHQPLLNNVQINIIDFNRSDADTLLRIMTNLVPLINSTETLHIIDANSLGHLQNQYAELAVPILTSARILQSRLI
jgi:hypothetical protein